MTTSRSRPKALSRACQHAAQASLAALILVATVASAQVFTCKAGADKVIQDRPCESQSPATAKPTHPPRTAATQPRPPMGDPAYEARRDAERLEQIKAYGQRAGREIEVSMAKTQKECGSAGRSDPFIGAHTSWVKRCSTWGAPERTHTTTTALGSSQMWVYPRRGHLYFDHAGQLRTIQSR